MDTQKQTLENQCLAFGIVGIALSETGLLGLIFSIIALSKNKTYRATYGETTNKTKTGHALGKAGLIISIIMTVFWIVFTIVMVGATISGVISIQ